jgi:hypothetical protein
MKYSKPNWIIKKRFKRPTWIIHKLFNRPTWIIDKRFDRPTWIIKVQTPIVYLYRFLRYAFPVFLFAIGIAFGATVELMRYM